MADSEVSTSSRMLTWAREVLMPLWPLISFLLGGLGGLVYVAVRIAYALFYGQLGLRPEDVGYGYSDLVAESIFGVLLLGPVAIVVAAAFFYIGTRLRSEKWQPRLNVLWTLLASAFLTGESSGVIPKDALAHGLGAFAVSLVSLALAALLAGAPMPSRDWLHASPQPRVHLMTRLRADVLGALLLLLIAVVLPIYAIADEGYRDGVAVRQGYASRFAVWDLDLVTWGGQIATVDWNSSAQDEAKAVAGDCLIYLGETLQQVVLYDVRKHRAVRIPVGQVTVSVDTDRIHC